MSSAVSLQDFSVGEKVWIWFFSGTITEIFGCIKQYVKIEKRSLRALLFLLLFLKNCGNIVYIKCFGTWIYAW